MSAKAREAPRGTHRPAQEEEWEVVEVPCSKGTQTIKSFQATN